MEEILFETERSQSRGEIADLLRTVADRLESGESLELSAGDESVTVDVPDRPVFEVKVEREQEGTASELSVEFELEWDENGGEDGDLEIA
ncbi:amphi-Trp domain-containing protein [Natronomonas marina]|jgi:amphi-Trp domain-containing protein|uniref:amphi-Trp domain-containing protein n=1 Tax=Natronomonas marina TaxID=2961939 RepID=UPI0020C98397|nr:amphi-Trp domain-containing protein [Natronomonas marina]